MNIEEELKKLIYENDKKDDEINRLKEERRKSEAKEFEKVLASQGIILQELRANTNTTKDLKKDMTQLKETTIDCQKILKGEGHNPEEGLVFRVRELEKYYDDCRKKEAERKKTSVFRKWSTLGAIISAIVAGAHAIWKMFNEWGHHP